MHVNIILLQKKETMQYYIEQQTIHISCILPFNNLGIENIKYQMFQMIIRKFTVAIILLNLSKYFSKNHGFGYRSLAHQDGSKSKVSSISVLIIFYTSIFYQETSIITSPYPDLDNCITQNQKEGISFWKNSANSD